MKRAAFVVYPLLSSLILSGCVSPQLASDARAKVEANTESADMYRRSIIERTDNARAMRERNAFVAHPYLVGKSVAVSPDVQLPVAFQANVKTALMFPNKRVRLPALAEQITLATKIPVVIAPDVYLPAGALLPRSQSADTSPSVGVPAALPAALPVGAGKIGAGPLPSLNSALGGGGLVAAGYSGVPDVDTPQDLDAPHEEMPLRETLDLTATRLGINWTYDRKKGVIRFYRMLTKTWLLPIKPGAMSYTSNFQNGTSQSNNQNALQTIDDKAPTKTEAQNVNEINSILNDVQTVMTRSGSVSGNVAQGTITITDTKDAVERAETIIDFHRAMLNKMVSLHVRLIQVTRKDSGQAGVDWNLLLTKALNNVPGFVLSSTSPATLVSATAGAITGQVTSGQFAGTQAVVQALSDIGNVASTDDIPLQGQNRHPIYYNNRVRYSYVSGTTPATATAGGTGGVPGITTAQDQVGLKLVMYPTVTDNNTVALTVSLDNSVLQSLVSFTSGQGVNQQTVQLPNVTGQGASTDALVRNGGMVVLTAFDHTDGEYDKRTLGHNIPWLAGGSISASQNRTATLIVISAAIRDSGAGQGAGS
jgi:type IVB pilus formation R64 PilN family outer membrane protein